MIREDGGADLFVPNRLLNGALHKDTVIASLTGNLGESDEAEVVKVVERGVTEVVGTLEKQKAGYGFVKSDDDAYFPTCSCLRRTSETSGTARKWWLS